MRACVSACVRECVRACTYLHAVLCVALIDNNDSYLPSSQVVVMVDHPSFRLPPTFRNLCHLVNKSSRNHHTSFKRRRAKFRKGEAAEPRRFRLIASAYRIRVAFVADLDDGVGDSSCCDSIHVRTFGRV